VAQHITDTGSQAAPIDAVSNLPVTAGQAVVFIAQTSSAAETRALEQWVAEYGPGASSVTDVQLIRVPYPKGEDVHGLAAAIGARLEKGDDPLLAPLRVAWLPKERDGERTARLRDVIAIGDPRHPRPRQQEWIRQRQPGRVKVLSGEPAQLSELRRAWTEQIGDDPSDPASFARFVGRRVTLSLERAESHLLGPRYKVPRLVREEVRSSARFRQGLARLAQDLGRAESEVADEAERCLEEIVTGYGRLQIDFAMQVGRLMYRQGYDEQLDYDMTQVEHVRTAMAHHPAVVLPTHRSNLDAGVMPVALHELGLPRTHTLAGINMSFWPLGPIMRRSGVIYIRRNIKANPVYRFVLREYIGYLVEKRFHLEWYIEGGRSRTGKLLPPRLGLLTYVVDAYRENRTDDVFLTPASITYDQLREVGEFAREAKGVKKKPETIGWFLRFWRSNRGRYGKIYVRFGEPLSLRQQLGPATALDRDAVDLQKLAFEVAWRINHVTPITATALVTLTLLSAQGRALTLDQIQAALHDYLDVAARQRLPMTDSAARLDSRPGIDAALDALVGQQVVTRFDGGAEAVYVIGDDQHLAAAFYRNSIIHFYLNGAIAELALVRAGEADAADRVGAFWDEAMQLRDLLKFDFFFLEKDEFRAALAVELALHDPAWQDRATEGLDSIQRLLRELRPLTAHTTLRSFFEAYLVVAYTLTRQGAQTVADERALLSSCEGMARQLLLQKRIRSAEAVSQLLFQTGLQLARHRGLLEPSDDLAARRSAFEREIRAVLRRVDVVEELGLEQFKRLLALSRG
jgi:glycerol-3-phosphate O-acyltransferase